MSDVFHDDEMAALEQQALFGQKEARMNINGVKVIEVADLKINRVLGYFGFVVHHHFGGCISICSEIRTPKKYSLFGFVIFTRSILSEKFLGHLHLNDMNITLDIYNSKNLPLASLIIKKLSVELEEKIDIMLVNENAEYIEYNMDAPQFLSARRQYLEQKLRTIESERENIEKDLSDVHKKLQALEGGGGPYRALSAVE